MSRSVKKVPGFTDRNPFMKNYANKRLRCRSRDSLRPQFTQVLSYDTLVSDWNDVWDYRWSYSRRDVYEVTYDSFDNPRLPANHMSYRKNTCSWDICDWKWFYWSPREVEEYCSDSRWMEFKGLTKGQMKAQLYYK